MILKRKVIVSCHIAHTLYTVYDNAKHNCMRHALMKDPLVVLTHKSIYIQFVIYLTMNKICLMLWKLTIIYSAMDYTN